MNDTTDDFDREQVALLFRDATDDLAVPLDRLVHEGHRRGVGLRRRRRLLQTAGGLACAAVLVGTVATGQAFLATPNPDDQLAAADPITPTAPTDPQSTQDFGVPAKDMATTLAALLPGTGHSTDLRTWQDTGDSRTDQGPIGLPDGMHLTPLEGDERAPYRAASLVYDDMRGLSAVQVLVAAPEPNRASAWDDAQALCEQPAATCTTVDAGHLVVLEHQADTGRGATAGAVSNSALLITDAGFTVTVTASNEANEKGGPTRTLPAFTSTELAAVATAAVWLA